MTLNVVQANSGSQADRALRLDRDRYVAFAFCSADLLLELDPRHKIIFVSGAAMALVGRATNALQNKNFLDFVATSHRSAVVAMLDQAAGGQRAVEVPVSLTNEMGTPVPVRASVYVSKKLGGHFFVSLQPGMTPKPRSQALAQALAAAPPAVPGLGAGAGGGAGGGGSGSGAGGGGQTIVVDQEGVAAGPATMIYRQTGGQQGGPDAIIVEEEAAAAGAQSMVYKKVGGNQAGPEQIVVPVEDLPAGAQSLTYRQAGAQGQGPTTLTIGDGSPDAAGPGAQAAAAQAAANAARIQVQAAAQAASAQGFVPAPPVPVLPPAAAGEPPKPRSIDFAGQLQNKLDTLLKRGDDVKMTMIALDGANELKERIGGEGWTQLKTELAATARGSSLDGETAGMVGEDKIGVVTGAGTDVKALEARIAAVAKAADPTGIGIVATAATVDLDKTALSGDEAASALIYAVKRMADAPPGAVTIEKMRETLGERVAETSKRIAEAKQAIAGSGWKVAYQPIVDLKTRHLHHYEALVRLQGAEFGASPFEFIRFAEDTGLICDFDLRLCHDVADALQGGKVKVSTAVNVSGRSIETPAFVAGLFDLLDNMPDLKGKLLFEITESSRIRDLSGTNKIVQQIRKKGFEVCLDDFGSGESAFEYLRALDVDFVKIDGSYVQLAEKEKKGKAFLAAMAALCTALGIQTVAERIEDETLIPFMLRCGIRYGQGYHFGKPAFPDQLVVEAPKPPPAEAPAPSPARQAFAANLMPAGPDDQSYRLWRRSRWDP